MVLQRWDPMYELRRMHEIMNRRWRGFPFVYDGAERKDWAIPLDVVEENDSVTVYATLPGVNPDDIDVTVEDDVLTIKAHTKVENERKDGGYMVRERRTGSFHRSLRLPDAVDAGKAEPRYENGVLTVTLPKVEAKKAKHLKVASGKASEGEKK